MFRLPVASGGRQLPHRQWHRCSGLALLLWLLAATAQAQIVTTWVTNTNASGAGSLLAAIQGLQPNYADVQDIRFFLFGPGVIYLNQPMPPIVGPQVRINGADMGPAGVTIDGSGHQPFVVAANSTTQSLQLSSLVIRHGGSLDNGGCIAVRKATTALWLNAVRVEGCRVYLQSFATQARGGAVFAAGPLRIDDSTFLDNQIESSAVIPVQNNDASGGAIYTEGAHVVDIQRSLFQNNRVYLNNTMAPFCNSGSGGAIGMNLPGVNLNIFITDSQFINNGTPCRNPTFPEDVDGLGDGGAIFYYGNGANNFGLANNYFSGNRGLRGGAVGVIQAASTKVIASNNTFYANQSREFGGALGIVNCCTATIESNTFSDNFSTGPGQPSQLGLNVDILAKLKHNLINGSGGNSACGLSIAASQNGSSTYNLISDGTCLTNQDVASQIIDYMFWLSAPTQSAGFTPTMHPLYGSPAIDSGDPGGCIGLDARYIARPLDGDADGNARCDIGAVESTIIDAVFSNGFE